MRLISPGLIVLSLLFVSVPLAYSEKPHHFTRDQSVINAFDVMCTLQLPDFDALSAKATAMHMVLQEDKKVLSAGDTVTRSRSWLGFLTTGPFVFSLDEMSGAKGVSTSCSVFANIPDVDAFRTEEMKEKHATDRSPEMGSDGSRSYIWDNAYGPGTTLIIRDAKPAGKPGVMIKLLTRRP